MSESTQSAFGGIPVDETQETVSKFGGVPTASTSQFVQTDSGVRLAISPTEFNETYESTGETLYDNDLINDVNYQKASKVLYEMNESVDAEKLTPEEYAQYGIEAMGWFNWNIPKMTLDASRISGATDEQKQAFLYMMEAYDDLGMSWNGAGRFFKGVGLDPTTWVGLSTFGVGLAGKEAAKQASKQGIKELLKASTRGGIIAGVESGVYTAVDDVARQVVETSVSGEDISLSRVAKSAAIGATAGVVLGTGITAGVNKLASRMPVKERASSSIVEELAPIEEGIRVKAGDRGNIGTVLSVNGDTVIVKFVNKEKGTEATRAFKTDEVKSVTKIKRSKAEKELIESLPEIEIGAAIDTPQSPAGRLRTQMDNVIKAVKRTVPAGKVAALGTDGVQKMDELVETVEPIKQLLVEASVESPGDLSAYLMKKGLTDGQSEFLEVATSQTVDALKTKVYNLRLKQEALEGDAALTVQKQIDEVEEVIAPLDELDAAMSTITGQRLVARKQSINTGELRGTSINSLIEQGLTRSDAEKKFDSLMKEKLINKQQTKVIKDLDKAIEKAQKSGNVSEFLKLKKQKEVKEAEFKQEVVEESGISKSIYDSFNKPLKVMNEVMISFVFSPATLIVNLVPSVAKTLYKPALNNLMQDGLSQVSRRKMMAEYSAMASMAPAAFRMAKAAWRYEKSMLTGDSARFLEEYNTIPKKYGGGALRVFPRALLATDAFFENIHYRGYAVGNATGNAMEAGVSKGLKGDELDAFVKAEVQKALDKAYAPEENAIDILMSEGVSRGLKGKKLENFINEELETNAEVFTKATDQDGRDYVQDILFKRDFSGNSTVSKLAKGYEKTVNENPIIRIMGQLFFRTPVRVFEEGIRLTPGLQFISPGYMKDLKGANGPLRQARAQGEALMSYSIAGAVFSLYATGNVTGAMGSDYKQVRQRENTGGAEPYTIKFRDGSTFNYRNFDPFSTPVKILVNALERAETLAYRKEQGERINDTEYEQLHAMSAIALGSITQSIRDANLASGVDAVMEVFETYEDIEGSDKAIKFIGRKLQTFLPNTYYKMQMMDNPVLGDPATLEHFIRQRVNPQDPLVPKQYTALGRPRTDSNPAAKLYYFNNATVEERRRGKPQKEIEVEEFLDKLSQVGDTHFTARYQMKKYMGDIDLRKTITKDGVESYYDRWMRYTHESGMIDALHGLRGLPMGTATVAGMAEVEANKIINQFREIAFIKLMSEEAAIPLEYQSVLERTIKAKTGQRSSDNIPHKIGNN